MSLRWIRQTFVAGALAFVAGEPIAAAEPIAGEVRFVHGQKTLRYRDWDSVHRQKEFGIEMSLTPASERIGAVIGAYYTLASGELNVQGTPWIVTGETLEVSLGLRRTFGKGWFRPYIAGGLTIVRASFGVDDGETAVTDTGTGLGSWFGGGLVVRLGGRVELGWALRFSRAEVAGRGAAVDGGGLHLGGMIGFAFTFGR